MEITSDYVNHKIQLFSDKLRTIRNEKGISAREMSLSLGQNVNYINLIENGKRRPSLDMFLYICEYLKVSPNLFFENEYNENNCNEKVLYNLSDNQKELLVKFLNTFK